jgi:hypothetical protein
MAAWAADCAERVLPLYEQVHPRDQRLSYAIAACRKWVSTGVFRMADIRAASLAAHAAARTAKRNTAACFAARSAGHAAATAHVPQHAFGASAYALKAVVAAAPDKGRVEEERKRQARSLPVHLRREFLKRVVLVERGRALLVRVVKGRGF